MSPGTRWIAGIVTTLTGGVLAALVLIVFAEQATAGRVVPDYYQRAARFDDDIAAVQASKALGWAATVAASRDAIEVCLRDRAGRPLAAHVDVTAAHRAHPAVPAVAGGATGADGCARVPVALLPGMHDVTITADAGDDHYRATAAREVK